MRKHVLVLVLVVVLLLMALPTAALAGQPANKGFDEFGYNRTASVFVGTGASWYQGKYGGTYEEAVAAMAPYGNDKLVMNWNAEWDRGNDEGWSNPPYNAWCTNQWNGRIPGGSGEMGTFKCIWVGSELEDSPYWREGGAPIWGQFEIVMERYHYDGMQDWWTKMSPAGLGGIL